LDSGKRPHQTLSLAVLIDQLVLDRIPVPKTFRWDPSAPLKEEFSQFVESQYNIPKESLRDLGIPSAAETSAFSLLVEKYFQVNTLAYAVPLTSRKVFVKFHTRRDAFGERLKQGSASIWTIESDVAERPSVLSLRGVLGVPSPLYGVMQRYHRDAKYRITWASKDVTDDKIMLLEH